VLGLPLTRVVAYQKQTRDRGSNPRGAVQPDEIVVRGNQRNGSSLDKPGLSPSGGEPRDESAGL